MLGKRIITALIGMAYTVYVINFGQWLYALTITFIAMMAWHEFQRMVAQQNVHCIYWLGMTSVCLFCFTAWFGNSYEALAILVGTILIALTQCIIFRPDCQITDAAFTVFGVCYIGLLFSHLILLRFYESTFILSPLMSQGTAYLWVAFLGTWASDTFAYFVGSAFGKHKLCPLISPGKTIEGSLGGMLGSLFVVACFGWFIHLEWIHVVVLGLIVGIMAPIGDLVESALKRFATVKDSGTLLPGHGGVLDRFDSILFVVPAVYYYMFVLLD
jgi:phosphatidate cytidylyltransferase